MSIQQELIDSVSGDNPVRRALVGVHWTAVSSLRCGMASTVKSAKPHGEDIVRDAGSLQRKTARQLAYLLLSENPLEAGIGLAALNSLIKPPNENLVHINAFRYLADMCGDRNVAIFGHFPYLTTIREKARKLTVFELSPAEGEVGLMMVPELLPQAEIIAITSNSIINHTLDGILSHTNSKAFIGLVGPSTPLNPLLFEHGISMLSGVRIVNEDALFQSISQAAIFRQVKGVELVTWIRNS